MGQFVQLGQGAEPSQEAFILQQAATVNPIYAGFLPPTLIAAIPAVQAAAITQGPVAAAQTATAAANQLFAAQTTQAAAVAEAAEAERQRQAAAAAEAERKRQADLAAATALAAGTTAPPTGRIQPHVDIDYKVPAPPPATTWIVGVPNLAVLGTALLGFLWLRGKG